MDKEKLKPHDMHDVETQRTTPSSMPSNPYHLVASDLRALREGGWLPRLPFITKAEVNEKNKSDSLVPIVAVVQIFWMVVQIISRASHHCVISQLEVAVLDFSICAIIIYSLNWEKPKGVQTPYTILQYPGAIPKEILKTIEKEPPKRIIGDSQIPVLAEAIIHAVTFGRVSHQTKVLLPGSPIPNHSVPQQENTNSNHIMGNWSQMIGFFLGGTVYGAVHLIAWDFVFPTLAEKKLWWAASVICTTDPLLTILIALFLAFRPKDNWKWDMLGKTLLFVFWITCTLYIAAKLFLIVEMFRTLCFLPPSAYVAMWATNVPHVT